MSSILEVDTSNYNLSFSGAFSIGGSRKYRDNKQNKTPGPGYYDQPNSLDKLKGQKWSTLPRNQTIQNLQNPGVGQYNINLKQDGIGEKGLTMSVTPHTSIISKFNTGPGSYDDQTKNVKNQNPAFSFQSKFEQSNSNLTYLYTPGPGNYHDNIQKYDKKKNYNKLQVGLGFGDKDSIYKSDTVKNPGPGEYPTRESSRSQIKFAQGKRIGLIESEATKVPGSGAYQINRSLIKNNSSFTLKHRFPSQEEINEYNKALLYPGPGTYDQDIQLKSTKTYKLAQSKRKDLAQCDQSIPGPGQYHREQIFSKSSQQLNQMEDEVNLKGFGGAIRNTMSVSIKTPGPQQYEQPSLLGKYGPKPVIPQSTDEKKFVEIFQVPGVGQYNIDQSSINVSQGISMKTKQEISDHKSYIPGVGSYTIDEKIRYTQRKGPQYSFGKKSRLSNIDPHTIFQTSPFSYNIKTNFGAIPKYLKKQKKDEI